MCHPAQRNLGEGQVVFGGYGIDEGDRFEVGFVPVSADPKVSLSVSARRMVELRYRLR